TWLKDRDRLAQVGGAGYLQTVLDASPVRGNVDAWAGTVRTKWHVRQMILVCQRLAAEGYGDYGDATSYAANAAAEVARTATTGATSPWAARLGRATAEWFGSPPPARTWLLRDARDADAGVLPLGRVGLLLGA